MIKQTKEEIANTLTHVCGVGMALISGSILIAKSMNADWQTQFAIMLFSCAVLLMYSASSIYHWTIPGRTKQILRYVDHINIYTLIAASYTPILLCSIKGVLGWSMFLFLWSAALVGAIYKLPAFNP